MALAVSISFAEYGGGYAGAPFRYGTNAREIALAGALTAEPNLGFQQLSNPAMITMNNDMEFGTSLFSMALDRSIQVISFSKSLPPSGAAGVTYFRSGTDNIQGRNLTGQKTENLTANDSYGMLTFGLKPRQNLAVGFSLKAVFNDIDGQIDGKGITVDVGALYHVNPDLNLGAVYSNMGGSTTWNNDGSTLEENLPAVVTLGSSYTGIQDLRIMGEYEIFMITDHGNEGRVRLGAESSHFESVFLRAGLIGQKSAGNSTSEELDLDFTFGLGISHPLWKFEDLRFDYAIDPGNKGEGLSHLFSWSVRL